MSSYKLVKSFWANVKGSLGFVSLCVALQQQDCSVGSSNRDWCLIRKFPAFMFICAPVGGLVSGLEMQEARLNKDAEAEEDTGLPFKCHKFSNIFVAVQPVVNLGHCLHHGPAMLP